MRATMELPEMPPVEERERPAAPPTRPAEARIRRAVRNQVEWEPRSLDEILGREGLSFWLSGMWRASRGLPGPALHLQRPGPLLPGNVPPVYRH